MEKQECIGCRTAFQAQEKLLPQNTTTEYKDFQLPLRQDRVRWALLKTIISFLNSQGGSILLGIEEDAVQGQRLSKKEQDTFKLFMKQLLEKVHPEIDLNHRLEVAVQFVPVLRRKEFEGRYVVKIIVQQGDPSRVYFFGERIKLEPTNGKSDEFQVFYTYERDSSGGTTEIKGLRLIQAIHERGKTPRQVANPPHEGCHPEPPHLELQIRKIHFSNTSKDHFLLLDNSLEMYFAGIDYESYYIEEESVTCMEIDDQEEFKVVLAFLTENIQEWNRETLKNFDVQFEIKGEKNNYFQIQNNPKARQTPREERPNKKQEKVPRERKQMPILNRKQPSSNKQWQKKMPLPKSLSKGPPSHFPKKFALTLTHINPRSSKQLQDFMLESVCKKMQKYTVRYINTMEIFLGSEVQLEKYTAALFKKQGEIASFGNKGTIYLGRNTGCLRISNYDANRRKEMLEMLQALMENDLKESGFAKQGSQYSLLLVMKDRPTACEWLDNILQGKYLWEFSDKSSSCKRHGRGGKIVIGLDLL